jgi:hypothetical protein
MRQHFCVILIIEWLICHVEYLLILSNKFPSFYQQKKKLM